MLPEWTPSQATGQRNGTDPAPPYKGPRIVCLGQGSTGTHALFVAAALLSHKEHAVRCVRPMVSVHPGIINSRDQARARRALARTGGPRRTPRAL